MSLQGKWLAEIRFPPPRWHRTVLESHPVTFAVEKLSLGEHISLQMPFPDLVIAVWSQRAWARWVLSAHFLPSCLSAACSYHTSYTNEVEKTVYCVTSSIPFLWKWVWKLPRASSKTAAASRPWDRLLLTCLLGNLCWDLRFSCLVGKMLSICV